MRKEAFAYTMPKHAFAPVLGQFRRWTLDSTLLENRLGDPTEREVLTHVSPEGMALLSEGQTLPVLIYLAPFTSSGPARAGWKAFAETLPQRHERLVKSGDMKPAILVMPDTFTTLGGNQFVDSPVLGNWSTWLAEALKPAIEERYATNGKFGLVGKSSGGYGAIVNAMLQPNIWDGVACHSGDMGFETMFLPTFAETLTHVARYGGTAEYVAHIRKAERLSGPDFHSLMICAMAASYDPRPSTNKNPIGIVLPVNTETADILPEAWNQWLEFDPIHMINTHHQHLVGLDALFIDCGGQDQYHIQYGSRKFVELLRSFEIEHTWEEFVGTHSGIDHRLDLSFAFLSQKLA